VIPGSSTYPGPTTYPGASGGGGSSSPPLPVSLRYTDQGNTRIYFLQTIQDPGLVPTRSELNNGTDLSGEVNEITGWVIENTKLESLTLDSVFLKRIPGLNNIPQASLTFYTSRNGVDVRGTLPRGTKGYVVFCDGGDTGGNSADVYPVLVTSNGVIRTAAGKDASKVLVQFAVTTQPAQSVPLPASSTVPELYPADTLLPAETLYPA